MCLLSKCPKDIVELIHEFNKHPFEVGDEMCTEVYDNGTASPWVGWISTLEFEDELNNNEWQHEALDYEVVRVVGNIVVLQGWRFTYENQIEMFQNVQAGEWIQREVQTYVDSKGVCHWWLVLREPQHSDENGRQRDEDDNYCPVEIMYNGAYPISDEAYHMISNM